MEVCLNWIAFVSRHKVTKAERSTKKKQVVTIIISLQSFNNSYEIQSTQHRNRCCRIIFTKPGECIGSQTHLAQECLNVSDWCNYPTSARKIKCPFKLISTNNLYPTNHKKSSRTTERLKHSIATYR